MDQIEDISNLSTEEIANKIFCDDIKPPRSIQLIYSDANVKLNISTANGYIYNRDENISW